MGQNQSCVDGSLAYNLNETENGSSNTQTAGSGDGSEEGSTRDSADKKMGAISQAQSVRAAIDTLIESCLVGKDDGMNGETVKAPPVGYSLEQLNTLKEDGDNSESSSPSTEKEANSEKEKTVDKDGSKVSKDSKSSASPKTFGSFMENSIIELIKKGEDEQEEIDLIGSRTQNEKGKHIGSVCDRKNSTEQPKCSPGDKTVSKTDSVKPKQTGKPQTANSPAPKRTVRLQTLIDTVLDNSLAHEMPSVFEKKKHDAVLNDLLVTKSDASSRNFTQTKPFAPSATKTKDVPENKMIYLMDHIEKVLEKNLEASYEDSDDDSNLHILNQLSRESPSSTSSTTQITESSQKTKQNDLQSRASSGSNSSEGTISVQDIVDRVISQTEVISKLLSPSDPAASRSGREMSKNTPTVAVCSQQGPSQQGSSQPSLKTEQARSPQSRPSSGSHLMEGHSLKASEHSPRGRQRAATYDSHQLWSMRHAQDSHSAIGHSLEKTAEYRQLEATSSNDGMHISKNGKTVPSPSFGTAPMVMPPFGNTLAPTSGIMSFAQSPVFRPPGHQMFVPRYPVPLLRVDLPSDNPQGLPPHPPSKSCACVTCVSKFRMEEHSPKHGMLGPVSPSSGMMSPHGQMDSNYYQQRLTGQLHTPGPGQLNPFIMRDYNHPGPNSPGRYPISNAAQMASINNKPAVGQSQKTVHYPPSVHPGGFSRDTEFHGYTSYEKQKLEMMKSERNYQSQHMQQVSVQNPFEAPRPDIVYNNVDPNFHPGRLEPNSQRGEDPRGGKYENVADKRLHSMPAQTSPAHATRHDDSRRERANFSSPILDLSVKKVDYRSHPEKTPSGSQEAVEASNQPLDLSKKSSAPSPNDYMNRQDFRTQKNEPVGFRKPEAGVKQEVNSKPHQPHIDSSTGRYYHSQQRDMYPYSGPSPSMFNMNARVPGPAEMAPALNPNMLISAGGQRPQLHPLPAPNLATSLMPSSSNSVLQTSIAHAHGAALPNQAASSADSGEKLQISGRTSRTAEPNLKAQRESPLLDSPDNSSEKGDGVTKRNSMGRNEPIQSIIGNHNPNDILYLICRICRQSNGSPYAFRKHFRNHHGFEPKAEHTIVQTISATKSARQNPYASNGPGGEGGQFVGNESVQNQDEQSAGERARNQKKENHGATESFHVESSAQNEATNKPRKSYGRSSEGKSQSSSKDNREDTKCLECPECKQTFQLNDFGSYKRHCRQHNQSRGSGSFVAPELQISDSQDPVDKMQGGITMCKICGVPFSVHNIEDHVRAVHGYFCSQCPDVFKTCEDLQSHLRSSHSNHFLPASSPGMRSSPRHSPSHASLPSNSPSLSNSPHHRSPSRSGIPISPGNVSQKSDREIPSPGELVVNVPTTKSSATSVGRTSSAESTNYGPISSTCEIERMPADNLTISASPDSSSDNVNKCSPSVSVVSDITVTCSLTSQDTSEDRNKVSSMKSKPKGDDDMDSTVSGSPSTDMIIDVSPIDGDIQTQNFFYKHKKFGGHRKRAESSDGSEVSAKVAKHGKDDCASSQNVNEDSSSSSGSGSCKATEPDKTDDSPVAKDQTPVVSTKTKAEGKIKQEARHQMPFVWDRVTRIQAGKNIKPPDYMT